MAAQVHDYLVQVLHGRIHLGPQGRVVGEGGRLQRSTQVAISTRASSVELTVPASTPARIASASLLTDLDVGDGFTRQDGAFWTPPRPLPMGRS